MPAMRSTSGQEGIDGLNELYLVFNGVRPAARAFDLNQNKSSRIHYHKNVENLKNKQ
jgi:hypothetical protein